MERIGGEAYIFYIQFSRFFSARCGEKCQHHLNDYVTCMCELTKFPFFYNQLMNSLTLFFFKLHFYCDA